MLKGIVAVVILAAVAAAAAGVYFWMERDSESDAEKAQSALDRGLAAHVDGNFDDAQAAYLEVLDHDPRNKFAYYNLALIDQTRGERASAENRYRLALNYDPRYEPALFNLALMRAEWNDYLEAIDLFRQVIAVNETNAAAHFQLGQNLLVVGLAEEGNAAIARAVELDPSLATGGPTLDPSEPDAAATPADAPEADDVTPVAEGTDSE
jgi:tetratricopeptide (TPR) repeat protein